MKYITNITLSITVIGVILAPFAIFVAGIILLVLFILILTSRYLEKKKIKYRVLIEVSTLFASTLIILLILHLITSNSNQITLNSQHSNFVIITGKDNCTSNDISEIIPLNGILLTRTCFDHIWDNTDFKYPGKNENEIYFGYAKYTNNEGKTLNVIFGGYPGENLGELKLFKDSIISSDYPNYVKRATLGE